jgi:hypothetical protein
LIRFPELQACLIEIMRACQVVQGERVVAYLDSGREHELEDAFMSAAQILKAEPMVLRAMSREPLVEPPTPLVEAMMAADFVLDLASESWLFTPATERVLKSGTRMLQALMPTPNILKKRPNDDVIRKARAAETLFESETELRIMTIISTGGTGVEDFR